MVLLSCWDYFSRDVHLLSQLAKGAGLLSNPSLN